MVQCSASTAANSAAQTPARTASKAQFRGASCAARELPMARTASTASTAATPASNSGSPMFCLKNSGTHSIAPASNPDAALVLRSTRSSAHTAARIQKPQSQSYSGLGTMQ